MIYLDTSMLVPLIVREAASAKARAWMDKLSPRQRRELALSSWTLTEFASALGLKVRNRDLTNSQAEQALALLHDELLPTLGVVEVSPTDLRLAETMLREFSLGLRAGDALHLAIAQRAAAAQFACLDKQLTRAASALGVVVATPG